MYVYIVLLTVCLIDQNFLLLFIEHSCKVSAQVTDETKCGNCRKEGELFLIYSAEFSDLVHFIRTSSGHSFGALCLHLQVAKVTFTTPLASRKVAQGHAYPATPSPLSHHNSVANDVCRADTPKEKEALVEGDGGKLAASSSEEQLTQQTVEQAMMANIGTHTNCRSLTSFYLSSSPSFPPPPPPPHPLLLSFLLFLSSSPLLPLSSPSFFFFLPLLSFPSHLLLLSFFFPLLAPPSASLMHLLQQVGSAYHALCQYDLVRAIRQFRSLPPNHHHTPWVLGQVARAYFVGEKFKEVCEQGEGCVCGVRRGGGLCVGREKVVYVV